MPNSATNVSFFRQFSNSTRLTRLLRTSAVKICNFGGRTEAPEGPDAERGAEVQEVNDARRGAESAEAPEAERRAELQAVENRHAGPRRKSKCCHHLLKFDERCHPQRTLNSCM